MRVPEPLNAIAERLARFFGRRRARELIALALPTAREDLAAEGVDADAPPALVLPLAIRVPGPLEPPAGSRELWAFPLGAHAIRHPGKQPALLYREPALPPITSLAKLRLSAFGLDSRGTPRAIAQPPSLALARPLTSALEQLLPRLMRPIVFAFTHEQLEISALRPASLGLDEAFAPPPRAASLPAPDATRFAWARSPAPRTTPEMPELGAARPDRFRIDLEGTTPSERDAPPTTTDRPPPPTPGRYLRPRTPLARAPLSYVDASAFRLDPLTGELPNESIIEARPQPLLPTWYLADYDRDFYRRWTPYFYVWGRGPLQNEWFSYWWTEFREIRVGPGMPFIYPEDRELLWQILLRCREQMMIRRDVQKLEEAPEEGEYVYEIQGVAILQHERQIKLAELIDKPAWIEITRIEMDRHEALHPWLDAYSDWRALKGGLEER